MRRRRLLGLVVLVVLLGTLLAACGDDDDDTTAGGTTATTEASGGGGDSFTLDEPMKVVLLAEKKGESPAAIAEFFEAASLAVDDLNADGGVGGKDVEFQQIPAPLDPVKANQALLQAVDAKPTVIVGIPASAQLVAVAPTVEKSGIPTFFLSTAGAAQGEAHWGFYIRPRNAGAAAAITEYGIKELGAKKLGLICVNNPFGTVGCQGAKDAASKNGAQIVAERTNEATATDMTEQVLAMKSAGADAVVDFNFPNPLGVAANQMVDNGLDVPHLDGASAEISVLAGAAKGKAAEKMYGVDDCWPKGETAKQAQDFVTNYQKKFNHLPNYAAAEVYDSIMMTVEAVKAVKSTDATKVRDQLAKMTYEGICDDAYKADSQQVMHHKSVIVNFPNNEPKVVKEFEVPDPNA
jgi:branched-chain amino acid transport system substrate-binding protein